MAVMRRIRDEWNEAASTGTIGQMTMAGDKLVDEIEYLLAERQAVLDCVNLYGDETLHNALDTIGWPSESEA